MAKRTVSPAARPWWSAQLCSSSIWRPVVGSLPSTVLAVVVLGPLKSRPSTKRVELRPVSARPRSSTSRIRLKMFPDAAWTPSTCLTLPSVAAGREPIDALPETTREALP
ncbi:MAG: hypothetical protein WD810_08705 [Solirubrobacterales bacterium]